MGIAISNHLSLHIKTHQTCYRYITLSALIDYSRWEGTTKFDEQLASDKNQ